MRNDVNKLVQLTILTRELFIGSGQSLVFLMELGFQAPPGRHILGHESGVADRVLRSMDYLTKDPDIDDFPVSLEPAALGLDGALLEKCRETSPERLP